MDQNNFYMHCDISRCIYDTLNPNTLKCRHIYEYVNSEICPYCGRDTHEPDFKAINKQNRQWLKDNPEAWRNVGWWSI